MRFLLALSFLIMIYLPVAAETVCDKTDAEWVSFADRQSRISFMKAGVPQAAQKEFMIKRISGTALNLYAVSDKLPDGRRYGVMIETSIKGAENCSYPMNINSGYLRQLPANWEPFEQVEISGAEQ